MKLPITYYDIAKSIQVLMYFSSDVRLVESALKTLTSVLSKVKGADSWPLVQELLVFLCTILDSNLAKERGKDTAEAVDMCAATFLQYCVHSQILMYNIKLVVQHTLLICGIVL